jgi:hypothetical protein
MSAPPVAVSTRGGFCFPPWAELLCPLAIGLPSEERISVDFESPRVLFAACTFEGVNWRADYHVDEPEIF